MNDLLIEPITDRWLVLWSKCIKVSEIKSIEIDRLDTLGSVKFLLKGSDIAYWYPIRKDKLNEELTKLLNGI